MDQLEVELAASTMRHSAKHLRVCAKTLRTVDLTKLSRNGASEVFAIARLCITQSAELFDKMESSFLQSIESGLKCERMLIAMNAAIAELDKDHPGLMKIWETEIVNGIKKQQNA